MSVASPTNIQSPLKVLLIGATGTLGSAVAEGFLRPEYAQRVALSVLTRRETATTAGPKKDALDRLKARGATILNGDADDKQEVLVKAFTGQDVIVSAIGGAALGTQATLITAAKTAGVKWFVPSEFGFDAHAIGKGSVVPLLDTKIDTLAAVRAAGLDYTVIATGAFSEYVVSPFFGVDIANNTITAPASFDVTVSTTPLSVIGQVTADAIVSGRGRNATIYTGESYSFGKIADAVEALTGKKLNRVVRPVADAEAAIAKNGYDFAARFSVLLSKQPKGAFWPRDQTYEAKNKLQTQSFEQFLKQTIKPTAAQ